MIYFGGLMGKMMRKACVIVFVKMRIGTHENFEVQGENSIQN